MAAQVFYGWRLLGAFWIIAVINLAFPAYGSAVLNAAMATELGFDRQALGTMVAVYLAMSGLPGPLVAASVNRIGVRWTLVIGSVFVIAGSVMLATIVDNSLLAILAFGLLVGIGVATGAIIAAQAGVARWFVRRRALAFSLLYSAGAIGGFIAPPILSAIATAGPGYWRLGWWLIAALSVVAALIAIATVREHPADLGQAPDGAAGNAASGAPGVAVAAARIPAFVTPTDWTYREALRGPYFWTMITPFIGVSAGFALFLGHGIVHLRDLGHSIQVGAWGDRHDDHQRTDRQGRAGGPRRPPRSTLPLGGLLRCVRSRDVDPGRRTSARRGHRRRGLLRHWLRRRHRRDDGDALQLLWNQGFCVALRACDSDQYRDQLAGADHRRAHVRPGSRLQQRVLPDRRVVYRGRRAARAHEAARGIRRP